MPLSTAKLQAVQRASKANRAAAARGNRAAGGPTYRKVVVHVTIIKTVDSGGAPLVLATSDAPNERGRYFQLRVEQGRWRCACASFLSLGGCHHTGHLAAQATPRAESAHGH